MVYFLLYMLNEYKADFFQASTNIGLNTNLI